MRVARRALLIVATLLIATGIALAAWRVIRLESAQSAHISRWLLLEPTPGAGGRLEPRRELLRADLQPDTLATVEVCALDRLEPAVWADTLELSVRHVETGHVVETMPLSESVLALAQRSGEAACLLLTYDEPLTRGGDYAVEAAWPDREGGLPEALSRIPMRAVAQTQVALAGIDRSAVVLVVIGALLVVLTRLRLRRRGRRGHADDWAEFEVGGGKKREEAEKADDEDEEDGPEPTLAQGTAWRTVVGVAGLVAVAVGVSFLPLSGALGGLVRGGTVAVAHVLFALLLALGAWGVLGLRHPTRAAWLIWAAPLIGAGLWYAGNVLGDLIPSTGVAPLQAFVSSPSGMLAVAVVAAAVPLAEELFYRGFLYGAIAGRLGNGAAFGIVVVIFTVAHVAQTWGAWGSVASILLTGLVLTGLRWWTGTIIVPVLTHLAHNAIIVYLSLAPAST